MSEGSVLQVGAARGGQLACHADVRRRGRRTWCRDHPTSSEGWSHQVGDQILTGLGGVDPDRCVCLRGAEDVILEKMGPEADERAIIQRRRAGSHETGPLARVSRLRISGSALVTRSARETCSSGGSPPGAAIKAGSVQFVAT